MSTVILGGGLSGLSAAYYLRQKSPKYAITIIEASNRVGGWIKSEPVQNDIIFELGPRTIRPTGPKGANTLSLIEHLGISDKVVPILKNHPASKNRMIYVNGQLHSLPSSLLSLFKKQEPFSKPLISYLAQDLFASKKKVTDESIYDFAQRRFGTEFADYLISALICGICAGNSKEISVNFLMKNLFEYEQKYGSISRGLLSNLFKFKKNEAIEKSNLAKRVKDENWSIYSLQDGMETLTKTLKDELNSLVDIQLNNRCTGLEMFPGFSASIKLQDGRSLNADHLISSLPAESLADLVENQYQELSTLLRNIKSATVGVVNLHYNKKLNLKDGFGFLVPPKEGLPILGVTYDTCCFPKGDNTVLTVMMGGAWFEKYFGQSPQEEILLQTAKEQLKQILSIEEEPTNFKVTILKKCIPQYTVGHEQNLQKIFKFITNNRLPLILCGASYHGVGINDVICSAKTAVDKIC